MWDGGKEVQLLIIPVQRTYCLAAENGKTAKRPSFGAEKGINLSAKSEDLYRTKAHCSSLDGVLLCTSRKSELGRIALYRNRKFHSSNSSTAEEFFQKEYSTVILLEKEGSC